MQIKGISPTEITLKYELLDLILEKDAGNKIIIKDYFRDTENRIDEISFDLDSSVVWNFEQITDKLNIIMGTAGNDTIPVSSGNFVTGDDIIDWSVRTDALILNGGKGKDILLGKKGIGGFEWIRHNAPVQLASWKQNYLSTQMFLLRQKFEY